MKGFRYEQRTGNILVVNGDYVLPFASGYAGAGNGLNNPELDGVRNTGPLPSGRYSMRIAQHPRFKAPAIALTQTEGDKKGRSGFWVHGDNGKANRSASSGCPIFNAPIRHCIAAFMEIGFDTLEVTA